MANSRVAPGDGPRCPRCQNPTQIKEHVEITAVELAKPFYYSRWYICQNRKCKTTAIMPDECKVFPTVVEDRFPTLSREDQRRCVAYDFGCDMNSPAGWPSKLVDAAIVYRLLKGSSAYYDH